MKMALNCGIVGLPNVGKSTIFQALTSTLAASENYPFCTVDPNIGVCSVDDGRLERIAEIMRPAKVVPATVEIVDIAGLIRGASKGEGLGNQFLGHIREVNAIVEVVRCFDDPDIIHVEGKVDPVADMAVIEDELILADLDTVEKRLSYVPKLKKTQKKEIVEKTKKEEVILERFKEILENGRSVWHLKFEEDERKIVEEFHLLTVKPKLYVCNVDESAISKDNHYVSQVKKRALEEKAPVIKVCGKLESEISTLERKKERIDFLRSAGLKESALSILTRESYRMLGSKTFFTAGEKEVRAWRFTPPVKAPEASGIIHSDFERGFIKAEVYHCEDLFVYGSEIKIREAGKLRIEGKNYLVQDGDVMLVRFNV